MTQRYPGARHSISSAPVASKKPKVAVVACMHKLLGILNALVRHGTPWRCAPGEAVLMPA